MADSSQGGLMGMLGGIDPSLLLNLGMGLMAGSRFGSNAGEGMMQGMQNYQSQRASNQDYQIKAMQLQRQQAMMQQLQGLMSGDQGGAAQPSAPSQPQTQAPPQPSPNASGGSPQGMPGNPYPAAASLPASMTPSSPDSMRVGGMNAKAAQVYSIMGGKDPLQAASEVRAQQQAALKQQIAPAMAKLDTIINSDHPALYAAADPEMSQAWQALAPHVGFDPAKDAGDDSKVRFALTMGRNQLGAPAAYDPIKPILRDQQTTGPLGAKYSTDPLTGKITQEVAPQETAQFVGNDGKPVMLTKAQGMAQGLQPFNPTIFGADAVTPDAVQTMADYARTHGGALPPGASRNPLIVGKVYDQIAKDSAASGDTMGAMTARNAALKANTQALDAQTKLESATKSYAGTMDLNIGKLLDAYQKAGSAGSPLINRAYRIWQQGGTGDKDTASMVVWLNAVQGEYAKLKSGSLGNAPSSDASMRDAKEVINKYMNLGGIQAVAQGMREESQNKMQAIGLTKQDLMGRLGQNAPGATAGTHPPDIQDLLKKYGSQPANP